MSAPAATPTYTTWSLPTTGDVVCRIAHCDVIRDRTTGRPAARFKVVLDSGEYRQFVEPWTLVAPALTGNGVVHPDALPAVDASLLENARAYIEVRCAIPRVCFTVRLTDDGVRTLKIAPRTLRMEPPAPSTSAAELADAVDAGVAAVKPVLEKHGLTLGAGDAIDIGRAVLEQRRKVRP